MKIHPSIASVIFLFCTPMYALAEGYIDPATVYVQSQQSTPQVMMIDSQTLTENLKKVGVTYELSGDNLNIWTDEQVTLTSIPALQSLGAINPGVTQEVINTHPITYSGVTAMFFTSMILPSIYQHSAVDTIHVTLYLTGQDEFGNADKHSIMTFDFNRSLFSKINWDKFQPQNLIKLAPNFKLDTWYEAQLNGE